jgi:thiamine pyrophosphokinase
METAIVASGELDPSLASRIASFSRIVAVDGGLNHCHSLNIDPHFLIGDLDSCSPKILSQYPALPRLLLPKDKDHTDLEVAVQEELARSSRLVIFGGWGGRIDHSLINALLLTRTPGKVLLETAKELLFALKPKSTLSCAVGQTLSLLPINGPATGITTSGLKWELQAGQLDASFTGISNVCLKSAIKISFESGSLLCCLEKRGKYPLNSS